MRIAVATPPYPKDISDGVNWIKKLSKDAALKGATIVCFPESYLPGYPYNGHKLVDSTPQQLAAALQRIQEIAAANHIAIIIPADAYTGGKVYNVAYAIDRSGQILGYQAKNQLDPSEDNLWEAGTGRQMFEIDGVKFGISICHEGFRYPETVRWAARQGAKIVFHPFYAGVNDNGQLLHEWGQKDGPYYEKAQMVRALENTIYMACSNYAFKYPEAASSIIDPQGNCIAYQPYGTSGVIVENIDLYKATGLLASRLKMG